ncbi:hypothetical protein L5515_001312 [Caenorhabditis briggsae]|uniref:Protein SYS1 homolog n=3 Tax=Caenorhabditis briggsae TaxID=6238 RepID=A0AAE9E492_CAEBR|nr:hypothetical protein L5515_001312 [Caenorhabditis briggsae]
MSSFRQFVWDPVLLISQMTCLQTFFYAAQMSVMLLCSFYGYEPLISSIFSTQTQRSMALIQLIASVGVSFALSYLVQRAKQCLDFACTVHFFHLICVTIYNRTLPTQFTWWILQVISTTVCTVLGEYLCMKIESQEIKLEGGPSRYDL